MGLRFKECISEVDRQNPWKLVKVDNLQMLIFYKACLKKVVNYILYLNLNPKIVY